MFTTISQYNYELIKRAIAHGCPAVSDDLIQAFDQVVQGNNQWQQHQLLIERKRQEKEEADKQAKALEEQKAKSNQVGQPPVKPAAKV